MLKKISFEERQFVRSAKIILNLFNCRTDKYGVNGELRDWIYHLHELLFVQIARTYENRCVIKERVLGRSTFEDEYGNTVRQTHVEIRYIDSVGDTHLLIRNLAVTG